MSVAGYWPQTAASQKAGSGESLGVEYFKTMADSVLAAGDAMDHGAFKRVWNVSERAVWYIW